MDEAPKIITDLNDELLPIEKRKTVGEISVDLKQKDEQHSAIDIQRASEDDYMSHLRQCVERGYDMFPDDYYIVVEGKREKLLDNVIRNYFIPRQSCPTPKYEQTVYKYHRKDEAIEFLWVVPDKQTCLDYLDNRNNIPSNHRELFNFIVAFATGELMKISMKLNKEIEDDGRNELKSYIDI